MSDIEKIKIEISQLQREIKELQDANKGKQYDDFFFQGEDVDEEEVEDGNDLLPDIDFTQIGTVDSIIYDIINDHKSQAGKEDSLECSIVDGTRVLLTQELKKVHDKEISKIQMENAFRFNGITIFPISNDPNGDFLGIRFDIFNTFRRQFVNPHYIILKQLEYVEESIKGETIANNGKPLWKWIVFQATIPKFVPVSELALRYLFTSNHYRDEQEWFPENIPFVPGFNRINKFAMRVHNELVLLETRRALVLSFAEKFAQNEAVTVDWDTSVSTVRVQVRREDGFLTIFKLKTTHEGMFTVQSNDDNMILSNIPFKEFNSALRNLETEIEIMSANR